MHGQVSKLVAKGVKAICISLLTWLRDELHVRMCLVAQRPSSETKHGIHSLLMIAFRDEWWP